MGETFKREEKLGMYMQVYNFETDEKLQEGRMARSNT